MKVSIIVAAGANGQIGLAGQLPWRLPADLALFRELTMGHHILMGRKTFESLPKPLLGRPHLILSRQYWQPARQGQAEQSDAGPARVLQSLPEGSQIVTNVEEAIKIAQKAGESELFVIGGGQIYEIMRPFVQRIYLSAVEYQGRGDTYFLRPDLPEQASLWQLAESRDHPACSAPPRLAWKELIFERIAPDSNHYGDGKKMSQASLNHDRMPE